MYSAARGLGITLTSPMVCIARPPPQTFPAFLCMWILNEDDLAQCPIGECGGTRAYFYMVQIRSADEPMTTFFKVAILSHHILFGLLRIDRIGGSSAFRAATNGGSTEIETADARAKGAVQVYSHLS